MPNPIYDQVKEDEVIGVSNNPKPAAYSTFSLTADSKGAILPTSSIISPYGRFGGDGTDGILTITAGTTNIALGGARYVNKNYTSINITDTGVLGFTNPHAEGTFISLRSQGNVTITSSTNPAVDLRSIGGSGGASSAGWVTTSAASGGGLGIGGAFGALIGQTTATKTGGQGGGGGGSTNRGTDGNINTSDSATFQTIPFGGRSTGLIIPFARFLEPGGGGGGGSGGGSNTAPGGGAGGAGGRGAGSLYIECVGSLNITSTFNTTGANGSNGSGNANGNGGGGGGGAGGKILILYNTLLSNTATFTVTGGSGGIAGSTGGGGTASDGSSGGAGESQVLKNIYFS